MSTHANTCDRRSAHRAGFSLVELLVAIAIIIVLAGLTVVAARSIAKDARISSAQNAIAVSLDNARAMAMRENRAVAVVFRARWEPDESPQSQFTEIVIATWTGESLTIDFEPDGIVDLVIDRFRPLQGVEFRALPAGIKVAGPFYDLNQDLEWVTQPQLAFTDPQGTLVERPGEMIGVMFGPTGALLTQNPASGNDVAFVDFSDGDFDGDDNVQDIGQTTGASRFYLYDEVEDEPNVNFVPFLAIYDDEEARELRTNDWTSQEGYEGDLTGPLGGGNLAYITQFGRRIHFNRYTGVVMTTSDQ